MFLSLLTLQPPSTSLLFPAVRYSVPFTAVRSSSLSVFLAVKYPVVMYSVLYTAVRSPSTPISASLFPVIWHNKPSILCPLFLSALLAEEAGLRFKMLLKFISLHTPTGFIVSVGCSVGGWGLPPIFLDFGENLVYSPLLLLFLPLLGVLFLHFRAPYFHHHCFY